MDERFAVVAGGGIGGLATAVALIARGWRVRVLEQAESFGEVGAGLSLWPNGLRALDAIGVGGSVRGNAIEELQGGLRDPAGRWLARSDTTEMERRFGRLVMIHRADFLEILRKAVPADALHTGAAVTAVAGAGPRVLVTHTGGETEADLLVGADGIRSAVRRSVWPDAPAPRYAGYTAWRVVAGADPGGAGGETWGRGERVGFSPLLGGGTYLYAAAGVPAGGHSPDGELAEMRRRFGKWHDPIPALLAATEPEAVLRHDIYDLPPLRSFATDRVALVGDAAHAMTPDLGQGANQALEDAVTLAAVLDAHPTVAAGLAAYESERRPRAQMIARRSRRIGAVAQAGSAPGAALRDLLMRITPGALQMSALASVLEWQPPAPPS